MSSSNLTKDDKIKSIMENNQAFNRLNLLKGYEGVWIQARRTNSYYILNKILSITIACFFAAVTLSVKKTTLIYSAQMAAQPTD